MPIEIVREPVSLLHIAELAQGTFGQLVKAVVDTEQQLMAIGDREITLGDLARLTRFTKRNVAVAVRSLALAAVVEVDRAGNEQRVRLARDIGLGQWIGGVRASYVDWVARFTVALRVLQFEVPPSASPRVRAIEAHALAAGLARLTRRSGLPEPDSTVSGQEFSQALDRWLDELAATFAP